MLDLNLNVAFLLSESLDIFEDFFSFILLLSKFYFDYFLILSFLIERTSIDEHMRYAQ